MAIEFKKTTLSGKTPTIWRGECKILPGGFKPKNTIPTGTVLKRALPLFIDFANMEAAVIKVAKVLTGGTTTKVRVAKGHLFAVSDVIMKVGKDDASPSISSIDTSNADYDVLNLSAGISGITADDVIIEASPYVAAVEATETAEATEAVPAAPLYVPNAVVGADKEFNGKGLPTIDAAYEAVVLYPSVDYPILDSWLSGGMCLKDNPNILFIKQ